MRVHRNNQSATHVSVVETYCNCTALQVALKNLILISKIDSLLNLGMHQM